MSLVTAVMATNLGRDVASSIGIVDSLTVMVTAFTQALALGGTVVVAQHFGRGDRGAANNAVTQAMLSGLVLGILLLAFFAFFRKPTIELLFPGLEPAVLANAETYLGITALGYPFLVLSLVASGLMRGSGDARLPMFVNIGVNVLNAAAGRVFMYGLGPMPGFGIRGAALAITIARIAGGIAFIAFLIAGKRRAKLPRPRLIRFDGAVLKTILAIGIPASIESLVFNGGKLITQSFSAGLGTLAITANYIVITLAALVQIPANAFSLAATPIVGQIVGGGGEKEAKETLLVIVVLSSAVLALFCLPMMFLGGSFVGLYTKEADILAESLRLLRPFCVVTPLFWSAAFILPSGLRGAGDSRYVMTVSMASMWTVRVGLGFLLGISLGYGMLGVWIAMFADWVIRSVFFAFRIRGKKWLHAIGGGAMNGGV
jgi:putative MATE family efflux protein